MAGSDFISADAVGASCRRTRASAREAAAWTEDVANAATVGRERDTLVRFCARATTRAQRLEEAVGRPMCVGVFGPSQAGKSYLVEVLARPATGPLRALFEGHEPVDFLSRINPVGEKESTGLVTRFTPRRASGGVPGYPVRIRALTELDLVKVLGNTFFLDGDQTKEMPASPEALRQLTDTLGQGRADAAPHLDDAALFDLEAYFEKQFAGLRATDALSAYWDDLRRLAPRLGLAERARLFAPLWGGHETFTRVFRQLAEALERLGHPDEIFVGIEALLPREGSILDVAALTGLGEEGSGDRLPVRSKAGHEAILPRPVVCAIAAELRIELAEEGRPFLNGADLLDFPGARSRQKVNLSEFLAEHPQSAKETFLRGKVAFLFDRYVAEQELTAMLLCVRPSNQEVVTLPDLVDDWIGTTHGRTPETRAGQPNLLFLVLTWFDSHFVEKAGDAGLDDAGLRFRNRLEASLLGFFGKAHRWPREWRPKEPFRNTFWFRNPNYPAESIIRYEGRREVEFLSEKVERVEELRAGFAALPEARAHFLDPPRAFDEALRLNDGGVSYLIERLSDVCRPELKLGQVAARLRDLRSELREQLERFHVPTDLGERLAAKREHANRIFDALEPIIAVERFGSLLRNFLIDIATLSDALQGAALRTVKANAAPSANQSRPLAAASRILRPGQAPASPPPLPRTEAGDAERAAARQAVEIWIGHLRNVASGESLARHFALPSDIAALLVDELIELAARGDIEGRIASDLMALSTVERTEQMNEKVALIAATRLNRLSGGLGFTTVPPIGEAPPIPDAEGARSAFESRPITYDARSIGDIPAPFGHDYATDWFHGFYRVAEENALRLEGSSTDMRQNERLKGIIEALRTDDAAAPPDPRSAAQA